MTKLQIPTSAEYIERIRNKSLNSDRSMRYDKDIAAALGTAPSTLSQYRTGQNMSVLVAVKTAQLLGLEPMATISATMYHQAKTEEDRKFWFVEYLKAS